MGRNQRKDILQSHQTQLIISFGYVVENTKISGLWQLYTPLSCNIHLQHTLTMC